MRRVVLDPVTWITINTEHPQRGQHSFSLNNDRTMKPNNVKDWGPSVPTLSRPCAHHWPVVHPDFWLYNCLLVPSSREQTTIPLFTRTRGQRKHGMVKTKHRYGFTPFGLQINQLSDICLGAVQIRQVEKHRESCWKLNENTPPVHFCSAETNNIRWSVVVHRTFLELHSKTELQRSAKQLKQLETWFKH